MEKSIEILRNELLNEQAALDTLFEMLEKQSTATLKGRCKCRALERAIDAVTDVVCGLEAAIELLEA